MRAPSLATVIKLSAVLHEIQVPKALIWFYDFDTTILYYYY